MDELNDILLIDKPIGLTSFGVVARIRRVLSKEAGKKIKVGHSGTLDPFASGLMILLVGQACKRAADYSKLDKIYEATICLGKASTTGDTEGDITDISSRIPEQKEIIKVFKEFVGQVYQVPPIYSAIKINGERAYKLARKGQVIEIPKRLVNIYNLELVDYSYPYLKIVTHVSSGTYIRSLAEDIGHQLGVGAYCSQLRRTKVGEWSVGQAKTLLDMGVDS